MFPNGSTNLNNQQTFQDIQNFNQTNQFTNNLSNQNNNNNNNLSNNTNQESAKANGKEINNQKIGNELSIEYENALRQEIELNSPLISDQLPIIVLLSDYENNFNYSKSIKEITNKYKFIRKVRRDGNCFYRSFIYRLFEHICMKNNKELFEYIKKKIADAKDLIQNNGYDWTFIQDFYNIFNNQFNTAFNSLQSKGVSVRDYLDTLFSDKEAGNYLIYFIRFCIAAYLKENSFLYEVYVDMPFQNWITNEVEAIDHEADQIQIMACVNYFDIGVRIEYLNPDKNEVMKFPEDKPDQDIFITVLFTPGHYDILYG